jgi:hypothetical protein
VSSFVVVPLAQKLIFPPESGFPDAESICIPDHANRLAIDTLPQTTADQVNYVRDKKQPGKDRHPPTDQWPDQEPQ